MKHICLYFQVHQPFRLRIYRFFDIGASQDYYHELNNRLLLQRIARKCYLPMNDLLHRLIEKWGKERFSVAFAVSGTAIEQMQLYAPEVLVSFQKLAETGGVEFIGETYAHSLAALKSKREFERQVKKHVKLMQSLFEQQPSVFRNTELVYYDQVAQWVGQMGFKAILAEGADALLGWRSPNYLYESAAAPLKLLLRNYKLSDDVAFRFSNREWSEWPLTAEKYARWIADIPAEQQLINLFMDYETFGEHQWVETGIFEFFEHWVNLMLSEGYGVFLTPSQILERHKPAAKLSVPMPLSWADSERDLTAWLGNELQTDAFETLYALEDEVQSIQDEAVQRDWLRLQTSDHFYYMCTKFFSDGDVHKYFNPYNSPYEAYVTYMNVLADFRERVRKYASDPIVERSDSA
ncbi:MAG: glycoside hydrolase family 57 protein [Bacteroidia bacterium]|nr:glycoside hydrolase family 57 protein [Bacteroidia bacterium]MDW8416286.1 glycoside hydrolase family 57 protein [Bacteroidia bacterium]